MSYKTLLVHLDDSQRCETRVALALELAERWDAHVIGLYVVGDIGRPLFGDEDAFVARLEALADERRRRTEDAFVSAGKRAGREVEWRAPAGDPVKATILHARHADLLLLGQCDPHDPATHISRHFVADVVMGAGRPVLVIPRAGALRPPGENVLIAWNGSREASRAIADAMPFLQRAQFVAVDIVRHADERGSTVDAIDVAAWLEAHGVRASFSTTQRRGIVGTGTTLLNRASELHADLLVLGAYAHSRASERVWGGVTRTMLESMTIPVLMAH
jgi:nucleotide-binding universal stress UspA family protein